jgi:hypothetical protein
VHDLLRVGDASTYVGKIDRPLITVAVLRPIQMTPRCIRLLVRVGLGGEQDSKFHTGPSGA